MQFYTRKWIKPEDLNPNGSLFGGTLLRWIDEEAAIFAMCQLGNPRVVTKAISAIEFVSSARKGDVIELGIDATNFGRTSITMRCAVRNKVTRQTILTIDSIVFVNMGEDGKPAPHGRTEVHRVATENLLEAPAPASFPMTQPATPSGNQALPTLDLDAAPMALAGMAVD